MKSVGIREAKAKLSELARAAAAGQPTLLTDYGKPLAVIAAMAEDFSCGEAPATPVEIAPQRSDFKAFRRALLSVPHELELDF
jgi:prevent-host-death family protein